MNNSPSPQFASRTCGAVACLILILGSGISQAQAPQTLTPIPAAATALEGLPTVRIDTTADRVARRELNASEAAKSRLRVRKVGSRYYWASLDDRPLTVTSSGGFTYLSSTEPGRYVRIRQLRDKLTYVEHVDTDTGSVTYWGELRIVLGK